MTAHVIDGKAEAARLGREAAAASAQLFREYGFRPGLATVLIGDDPASQVYVRNKNRACIEAGLASFHHAVPATTDPAALLTLIAALNRDERVDGILVQLPLPAGLDPAPVIAAIDPAKDVDGFHPTNIGRLWSGQPTLVPCTPQGCVRLLRTLHADLSGAEAVVLGRSGIVGRPLAALLIAENCTVTVAHSRSREVAAICRRADILVAAVGHPEMVKAAWIKPGATVIDVGINRVQDSGGTRLVGDVEFAAACAVAGAVTPVPGGVGPMTIACLLRNTIVAACRGRGLSEPFPAG